jgi:hypothetical protein
MTKSVKQQIEDCYTASARALASHGIIDPLTESETQQVEFFYSFGLDDYKLMSGPEHWREIL